jgi:hypothetical protein
MIVSIRWLRPDEAVQRAFQHRSSQGKPASNVELDANVDNLDNPARQN